jgi:hypothetical protein
MMKKVFGILALVFLVVLGMKTGALAQDVEMHINMFKDVSSNGETYGISFELSNDVLKKVTRAFIDGPRGARIRVNNPLNLNGILLSAVNLSLKEFTRWFPEGDYKINLTPPAFGKLKVHMTHNFPLTPAVLYPLAGSVNVPTNPVITWAPITGIIGLQLQLKDDAGFVFGISLPINATSYSVPANLLNPNTHYELSLGAKVTDLGGNNGLITTMIISFTTVPE